jgi:hypothetical protein
MSTSFIDTMSLRPSAINTVPFERRNQMSINRIEIDVQNVAAYFWQRIKK